MAQATLLNPNLGNRFRYDLLGWFALNHVMAGIAIWYLIEVRCHPATVTMGATLFFLRHLSITMGPHRLYSHMSYTAHKYLEIVLLVLFSGCFQNSALWWAVQHMRHHTYSDTERDPYTVNHGFWWAHFIWVLYSTDKVPPEGKRLAHNLLLVWQQRWHRYIGFLVSFVFPTALAWTWGDLVGGFLTSFLTLSLQYHATWAINSVAHTFGPWRYSARITARVCYWVILFTVGEWNHEPHHHASSDYRLGNRRWYDLDPGKWMIWSLQWIGATSNLKRVSDEELDAWVRKAKLAST